MGSSESRLLDADIRPILRNELRRTYHHGSIIRDEFSCNGARVDLAVVNGRLHGFEIKSDHDSLDRLATQSPTYNALFDRMTIVVGSRHVKAALDHAHIPLWWGIREARRKPNGGITLHKVRQARSNDNVEPNALATLLWRKEIWTILRKHGQHADLRFAPAFELQRALAERLPFKALRNEVREAIKARLHAQSAEPRLQSDGSCTIASTVEDYQTTYETNLNWLLNLRSRDLPR